MRWNEYKANLNDEGKENVGKYEQKHRNGDGKKSQVSESRCRREEEASRLQVVMR